MIEIFENVPEYTKIQTEFWVNLALKQRNFIDGLQMLDDYRKSCLNDKEREFVDFYLSMEIEKRLNS